MKVLLDVTEAFYSRFRIRPRSRRKRYSLFYNISRSAIIISGIDRLSRLIKGTRI
jgi:hypothetical protein